MIKRILIFFTAALVISQAVYASECLDKYWNAHQAEVDTVETHSKTKGLSICWATGFVGIIAGSVISPVCGAVLVVAATGGVIEGISTEKTKNMFGSLFYVVKNDADYSKEHEKNFNWLKNKVEKKLKKSNCSAIADLGTTIIDAIQGFDKANAFCYQPLQPYIVGDKSYYYTFYITPKSLINILALKVNTDPNPTCMDNLKKDAGVEYKMDEVSDLEYEGDVDNNS